LNKNSLNKNCAQVFIATTNGLVQVESILPLSDPDISSVATIGGTSQLAGINAGYKSFVEKPQGLITSVFGGHAYRLNLSQGIDQGESWQLGVFIAHYLHKNGCLSGGDEGESVPTRQFDSEEQAQIDSNNKHDEIIFIATGKIDTTSMAVLPIDALAKKCLLANSAIKRWQREGKTVCFLAPLSSFRQPVPDTIIKLTPISSLQELKSLCAIFDLPVLDMKDNATLPASSLHAQEYQSYHGQQAFVSHAYQGIENTLKVEPITIEADERFDDEQKPAHIIKAFSPSKNIPWWLLVAFLMLVALSVYMMDEPIVNQQMQESADKSSIAQNMRSAFVLVAEISANKMSCANAAAAIIDKGTLTSTGSAHAVNLSHLCKLHISTSQQVANIWLVSDSKAIFPIDAVYVANTPAHAEHKKLLVNTGLFSSQSDPLQWSLPLPNFQSQTRNYTLLVFFKDTDEADLSSLDSYLLQLHNSGITHSIEDLQNWVKNAQGANTVVMLSHELSVQH
jgi:hypothetical protein